jgi:hypothetical protein
MGESATDVHPVAAPVTRQRSSPPLVLRCLLPFSYAQYTRFTGPREIVLHALFDWLSAFLLLVVVGHEPVLTALAHFVLGYLAFISIYECGYIANDLLAVRLEQSPRDRLVAGDVSRTTISAWVSVRLAAFAAVTFVLHEQRSLAWYGYFVVIAVAFAVHNSLRQMGLRAVSFVVLAFLRFFGPVFAFLSADALKTVAPSILVTYVLYRALGYMESKGLLNIPRRATPGFRLGFYAVTSPLALLFCLMFHSWTPALVHGYYLTLAVAGRLTSIAHHAAGRQPMADSKSG